MTRSRASKGRADRQADRPSGRLGVRLSACAVVVGALVCQAAGQTGLVPPENNSGIDGKPWLTGFVMILLVGLVGVGAFLKSKRGHQD